MKSTHSKRFFSFSEMNPIKSNIFAILSFLIFGISSADAQCADTANIYTFSFNGHQYEVVRENSTWTNASLCAVSRNGYLAEINDVAEQDAIFTELTQNAGINTANTQNQFGTASVWIGGSDAVTEGEWIWDGDNDGIGTQFWSGGPSGMAIGGQYTNWGVSPAEPDNSGGQDHLTIIIKPTATNFGLWNDLVSSNSIYYLIEIESGVGMTEIEQEDQVNIYPNPVENQLSFSNSSGFQIDLIEFYDRLGKKVLNVPNVELSEESLDVSALTQGMYTLQITLENGQIVRKKIVKK